MRGGLEGGKEEKKDRNSLLFLQDGPPSKCDVSLFFFFFSSFLFSLFSARLHIFFFFAIVCTVDSAYMYLEHS